MESRKNTDKVLLELTKEESIVLLDWLTRFNQREFSDTIEDQAEQRILWDMEVSLEKIISETFDNNYIEILSSARKKLRD